MPMQPSQPPDPSLAAPLELQDDRIDRALLLAEDERLDFKRVGNVDVVTKTACAMANTKGGWIVLGLEDSRKATGRQRVYGIDEKPECLGEIQHALVHRIQPPVREPHAPDPTEVQIRCTLRGGQTGTVVLLRIGRSNAVHSVVDGGTYIRCGPTNRQLSASEITDLSLRRGTQSAVDATVDVPIDLLNTSYYGEYAEHRQLSRPIADQLRHLGLLRRTAAGEDRPTRAAVLLFAESPGGLLNQKCAIRVFHYIGHQIEHTSHTNLARPPSSIDGPVLIQIRRAVELVMQELERGVQVSPSGFNVRQKYPLRVVQEAITNAVIHRDQGNRIFRTARAAVAVSADARLDMSSGPVRVAPARACG